MSDTKKEVEKLEEVNAAVKDAAPGEATHLKNDAVDMGAPVVKPTDKNPDAASKAKQNTSDPALKSAKDGSNPAGKGDMKPTSMKEEEVEIEATEDQEVVAEEETKEVEIDLSADVKALVSNDADLSEEFKDKAATIFETAVKTRIQEQTKILEAQYEEKLESEKETIKEAGTGARNTGRGIIKQSVPKTTISAPPIKGPQLTPPTAGNPALNTQAVKNPQLIKQIAETDLCIEEMTVTADRNNE